MRTLYADIIVDISHEKLDKTFQYRVPERLRDRLEPGACVMIPFGNGNRLIKGYVVSIGDQCQFAPEKIKEIAGLPEKETGVEDKMIALAAWIRRNYGCTMIQALKTVLPAKQTVKKLEHRQLVRLMSREEILSLLGECERKKQVAKARLFKALSEQETIPYEWITGKLGVSAATVNSIVKVGAAKLVSSESYRNPVKVQAGETTYNTLSEEQQYIITEVLADFDAGKQQTYLIHGITGSGKTEVYMQLIGEMIKRGRQAIVLIPEIALTYQTLLRFYQRFGDRVSVMNSTLSPGEKYDQCERAKAGEIDVIIGPRSALFTPFPNLGLIVMDEEQENSYKSESTPKSCQRDGNGSGEAVRSQCSAGLGDPFLRGVLPRRKGRIQAVPSDETPDRRRTAHGTHGGSQTGAAGGQSFYIQQEVTGTDDRPAKQGAADHPVFKSKRVCRIRILPCLR